MLFRRIDHMLSMVRFIVIVVAGLAGALGAGAAQAAYIPVCGGPTYDASTSSGYTAVASSGFVADHTCAVNSAGVAIGQAVKYVSGSQVGSRAMRWSASDASVTELGTLGTSSSGVANAYAVGINEAGTVVGSAYKYVGGVDMGERAVRWSASGTDATELGNLGTDLSGQMGARGNAINDGGTAVGWADTNYGSVYVSPLAVRWSASDTAATQLGDLGKDNLRTTEVSAIAINNLGTAVGYARKCVYGTFLGYRAVRWSSTGTGATELGNLGTGSSGSTDASAYAINDAGTAVGYATAYLGSQTMGPRPVRWSASSTIATQLGNLGVPGSGQVEGYAYAINNAGTAVGFVEKFVGNTDMGRRAVLWSASGTAATELGNLGVSSSGSTMTYASAINNSGKIVGHAESFVNGVDLGQRAVLWNQDGTAVDLNGLIDPASGWILTDAQAISDTNWVVGTGSFDLDGAGPTPAYDRMFLIQVPEPATLAILALGSAAALVRRRRMKRR